MKRSLLTSLLLWSALGCRTVDSRSAAPAPFLWHQRFVPTRVQVEGERILVEGYRGRPDDPVANGAIQPVWFAVDPFTGQISPRAVAGPPSGPELARNSSGSSEVLSARDPASEKVLWTRSFSGAVAPRFGRGFLLPKVLPDERLCLFAEDAIQVLDLRDGRSMQRLPMIPPQDSEATELALGPRNAFVLWRLRFSGRFRLTAYSLINGREVWSKERSGPIGEPGKHVLSAGGELILWTSDRVVHALDAASGDERWRWGMCGNFTEAWFAPLTTGAQVWVSQFPEGTYAFPASLSLPVRDRTVSGRVQVTSQVEGVELSDLSGIAVVWDDARTVTDREGNFVLRLRGRGTAELQAHLSPLILRPPRGLATRYRADLCHHPPTTVRVDLESSSGASPLLLHAVVTLCPWE